MKPWVLKEAAEDDTMLVADPCVGTTGFPFLWLQYLERTWHQGWGRVRQGTRGCHMHALFMGSWIKAGVCVTALQS